MIETLMELCETKGAGKRGETLFASKQPDTKKSITVFYPLTGGGEIHRLLTGNRSCEDLFVLVQTSGSGRESTETQARAVFNALDAVTNHTPEGKSHTYMSILAMGPLNQVDLDTNERFVFEVVFKVLRKER